MNFPNCPTATVEQLRTELYDAIAERETYRIALLSSDRQNPVMAERTARALISIDQRIGLIRSAIRSIEESQNNKNT